MTMFQNGKMMPTTPNRKTNFSFLENEDFNPEILIVVGAAQTTLSDKFSSYINRNKEKHNIIFEAELELNLNPSIFGNSHSLYLEGWRKEEYHKAIEGILFFRISSSFEKPFFLRSTICGNGWLSYDKGTTRVT